MVAFARFRLLLATVRLGNIDQATTIYQTAQAEDADYAVWSRAFWEAYQDSGNVDAGCQATIAATRSQPALLEPLNSFGYANPTFEAGDLCPAVEQLAEATLIVGVWEDYPPQTYPPPVIINEGVVFHLSAGCPNLTQLTERMAADQVSRDDITAVMAQFTAGDLETRMQVSDQAFWPFLSTTSTTQPHDSHVVKPDAFSDPQPASASPYAGLIANACGAATVDYSWWVQSCPGPCDEQASTPPPSLTGNFYLIKRNGQWLVWAAE
jgi:hypothetical protein